MALREPRERDMTNGLSAAAAALILTAGAATAGGIETSNQSILPLFERGQHISFTYAGVFPSLSGEDPLGGRTGSMTPEFHLPAFAYKNDLNDTLSYAVVYEQPYGAGVSYRDSLYEGTRASVNSHSVTGLLRYKLSDRVSVYGGLRLEALSGNVSHGPGIGGYTLDVQNDWAVGYVLGAAYEIPEYFMRASLTYNSAVKHENPIVELGADAGETTIEMPESLVLDLQSPVNESTLIFGSVRYVRWSAFHVTPPAYEAATGGPLLSFEDDTITYNIGVARKFSDRWTGLATLGYEKANDRALNPLLPLDGYRKVGLGAIYTQDKMTVTGVIEHISFGDSSDAISGSFTDNSALALGVKVAFNF